MMREPKRDYRIAILLAFLVLICFVPLAGAKDKVETIPVETTTVVPTDAPVTSPMPTPTPVADFPIYPTSGSGTAPSAVQFLDASTNMLLGDRSYNQAWVQQTAAAGWTARRGHSCVVMPDGSIVLMGGYDGSYEKNDIWRSTDKGATWTQQTAAAGWSPRYGLSSVVVPDGSIVLMGGNDGGYKNDVWRLPPAVTPQTGSISISSDPLGATIYLDEINQGVTPLSLENIPFGVHVVKLTLEGYEDWTDNVELTAASPSASVNPTLSPVPTPTPTPPQTGSISISSDPPGATIYLDNVYQGVTPQSLGNIPFGSHVVKLTLGNYQDWSDNVELTAGSPTGSFNAVLNQVPPTYSMTRVFLDGADNNTHARYVSDTVHAQYEFENLEKALSEAGWGRPIFDKIGSDVTLEDFGTNGGGLAVTTIHWHNGHGWFDPNNLSESGIELIKNDGSPYGTPYILSPDDVAGKWNMNNKWVVLEACLVLRDPRWNKVLGTTHGIFGFTTGTQTRSTLPTSFFRYSMDEKMPLSMAWQSATQDVFNRVPVPDYLEDPNRNIQMRAGVRFDTEEQYNNDHFPGYGSIAPDGNPQSGHKFLDWPCSKEG